MDTTTSAPSAQPEGSPRLLVACVAEDSAVWAERVYWLAYSIRQFGHEMATVPMIAYFVGSSSAAKKRDLEALGVAVRVVARFDERFPWANKLRMLENLDEECDVLLALDCDVAVMGDVSGRLSSHALGAMVEWDNNLTDEQWRFLYDELGVKCEKTAVDPLRGTPAWPYLNSGVLAVPRLLATQLFVAWSGALEALRPLLAQRSDLAAKRNYIDQMALAIAVQAASIPTIPLSPSLNCHTGGFPDGIVPPLEAPFILHYHRNVDDQRLLRRSGNHVVDREIHRFNLARAAEEGLSYVRPARRPFTLWMTKHSPRSRRVVTLAAKVKEQLAMRRRRTPSGDR